MTRSLSVRAGPSRAGRRPTHPFEVARIDVRAEDIELTESFAIATGAQQVAKNVIVRVELEGGAIGLGEAAPFPDVSGETQEGSLRAINDLGSYVVGENAAAWRKIAGVLLRHAPEQPAARSAIEQAVLDAFARAAGCPLRDVHGCAAERVVTDVTVTAGNRAHAAKSAGSIAARGFHTIKVKIGSREPAEDVERLAAVREAAPEARLIVDANGGYDVPRALAFTSGLAKRGISIALFEEPIARGDAEALARVRAGAGVPIYADESVRSSADVIRLVKADAVDGVNVKITKLGVAGALEVIDVARAAGLATMIGGMVETEIAMMHSAHLASGLGGFSFVDLDTPLFMRSAVTVEGYPLRGDEIRLEGDAPGLGLTLIERLRA